MIQKGANPFVVSYLDQVESTLLNLAKSNLSNLPSQKSVYFTVRPHVVKFEDEDDFLDPWFYRTGVFGTFDSVIGHGASGIVLRGDWFGRKAAFKFVDVGTQYDPEHHSTLKTLNEKLLEITSIQEAEGRGILPFYGHYR